MTEHHALGVAEGPRGVDDDRTLISFLGLDDLVQLGVGNAVAKFHEVMPLWMDRTAEDGEPAGFPGTDLLACFRSCGMGTFSGPSPAGSER